MITAPIFSCNSLADVSNSSLLSIFVAYSHTSQGTHGQQSMPAVRRYYAAITISLTKC